MAVKFTKYGGFSYDPIKQYGSKAPKKKKEPEPEPAPKKEEKFGIMRDEKGVATGFRTPSGEVFLGQFNKQEEASIRARYEPEQARATARQEAISGEEKAMGALQPLEQAGAFEKVTPGKVSLAPQEIEGAVGPSLGALSTIAGENSLLGIAKNKGWFGLSGEEMIEPIFNDPETLREIALRKIREESFKEGVSQREKIGAAIEAIPLVGNRARAWAGKLVEAPYENTHETLSHINVIKEAASTGQEKVRNGLEDPEYGLSRARDMEELIAKLEGRIKALINTSAVLRSNTDEVNKIQEEILIAKEKVARYRQASTFGLTAQLTGTGRTIPTDEQIYFELKELNERQK